MGGTVSAGEDNEELVDNLVEADYIKTQHIETALRAVDRGNYYLEGYRDTAYKDLAWKNGNLHLSAPCIYSEVLECLKLSPGQSFLNLGSGTGYLSTVAGLLLGTYGINHGVEQHADVVEYANQRLTEFLLNSPALDMMDFCKPFFVVGNCLQLEPSCSVQAYDRVYCGAAVPPEYLAYIRNLVKVGGIVVMPSGDQLLQIQRTKEDVWETKSVLPVSFATLVEPSTEDRATGVSVMLPDRMPLKLQEICRATVRSVLRQNIHSENPDFKMRSVLQTRAHRGGGPRASGASSDADGETGVSRRGRRFIRRILIPVFRADSDEEDLELSPPHEQHETEGEEEESDAAAAVGGGAQTDGSEGGGTTAGETRRRLRRPVIAIGTAGVSRRAGGRLHMEDLRWNRFYVGGNTRRPGSADEENNSRDGQSQQNEPSNDQAADNGHQSAVDNAPIEEDMRDSLDFEQQLLLSGATDTDGHGRSMEDAGDAHPAHQLPVELAEDVNLPPLTDPSESDDEANDLPVIGLKGDSTSDKKQSTVRSVDGGTGEGTVSSVAGESSKRSHSESEAPEAEARRKRAAATATAAIDPAPPAPGCQSWRGATSDSDASDAESETHREQQRRSRQENVNMQKKFSQVMSAKILQLPVPDSVKAYLNHYRK